jgi:hypothetical protein
MNWPFIVRCLMFGVLWAIWQAASSVYVLDTWPTAFTWLKIGSAAAVAFVGGCLTYARDPEAALKASPLAKAVVLLSVLLSLTAGCAADPALGDLRRLVIADSARALEWATADGDVLAADCYRTLNQIAQTAQLPALHREPNGLLTTTYLVRSTRRQLEGWSDSGLRTQLLRGCAAYVADERDVLIKLGVKGAPVPIPLP